ncbi:hypothetical protein HanIR_Chr06g0262141 [Helianthus annuus]|nr:hypothetical protein HanIR_Chr06g0262141 [Helianthus annuus]
MSSSDNIILENLDSGGESSGQNHSDVTRRLDSDTRALIYWFFLILFVSPDVISGGVSDISSREARRNTGATCHIYCASK